MDLFTHLLIAIIISIFTLNSMPLSIVIYASIMAIIADLDIVLEPLRKLIKSNLLAHKGISHSLFYSVIISAPMGGIFSIITKVPFLTSWVVGFLFYDLHILLDFLTASKIPLFYPLTKKRFRFFIDRAINFYLALISGSIIVFYILAFFFWQELIFSGSFYYLIGFYISYFIFRILIKVLIYIKYSKTSKFIPGVSPFSYLLYTRNETKEGTRFKLLLKNIFKHKPKLIFESEIKENSYCQEIYLEALNLVKKFPFGEKWHYIIPIFEEVDDNVIVYLLFAESYFQGNCYNIKIKFDKQIKKVLELSDSFNRKK